MKIFYYGFCSLIMLITEVFGAQAAAGSTTITIFSLSVICVNVNYQLINRVH